MAMQCHQANQQRPNHQTAKTVRQFSGETLRLQLQNLLLQPPHQPSVILDGDAAQPLHSASCAFYRPSVQLPCQAQNGPQLVVVCRVVLWEPHEPTNPRPATAHSSRDRAKGSQEVMARHDTKLSIPVVKQRKSRSINDSTQSRL